MLCNAREREGACPPVFLDSRLEHPAEWICARYKSSVLLLSGANFIELLSGISSVTSQTFIQNVYILASSVLYLLSSSEKLGTDKNESF